MSTTTAAEVLELDVTEDVLTHSDIFDDDEEDENDEDPEGDEALLEQVQTLVIREVTLEEEQPHRRIGLTKLLLKTKEYLGLRRRAVGLLAIAVILVVVCGTVAYTNLPAKTATAKSNGEQTVSENTNQHRLEGEPLAGLQAYQVKGGDTLFAIAQKNGITVADILNANRDITNPDLIVVGQTIVIPEAVIQQQPTAIPPTPVPTQIVPPTEIVAPQIINTQNLEPRFTGILQHPNVITSLRSYASKYMVDINGFAVVVQSTLEYYSGEDPGAIWNEFFGSRPQSLDDIGVLLQGGKPPQEILVRR
jgi:LysM repeat protein